MTKETFEREMAQARTFYELGTDSDYWRGYMRGLRRRYHGENFGDVGDHEKWLDCINDDYRRELGQGYRDGYFGPCDWADPAAAVKTMRTWRDWNTADLADRLGVSARTVEGWEQGRPVPGPSVNLLKSIHLQEG